METIQQAAVQRADATDATTTRHGVESRTKQRTQRHNVRAAGRRPIVRAIGAAMLAVVIASATALAGPASALADNTADAEPPQPSAELQVAEISPAQNLDVVFGAGTLIVGTDIAPGTYRSINNPGEICYWERLSGFSGELSEIITNGLQDFSMVVTIHASDVGFSSTAGCFGWVRADSVTWSTTPTGAKVAGTWHVGREIAAGTWQTWAEPGCYWERLSSFDGDIGSIISNDFMGVGGPAVVTIEPGDAAFASDPECGVWTRVCTQQPTDTGYWLVEEGGVAWAFGDANDYLSPVLGAGRVAIDIERTSTGCGYWVIDNAGVFYEMGDAPALAPVDTSGLVNPYDFGLAPDAPERIVSVIPTATNLGAYVFTSIGRVLRTGDAPPILDGAGREDLLWISQLNSPIVDARLTIDGTGYWMLAQDGGVFSFGGASFHGSVPQHPIEDWQNEQIVSFGPDLDGTGYIVVAASGKAWWFDMESRVQLPDLLQQLFGSPNLNQPIVAVVPRPCGGYIFVASDGGVFATPFSDCGFQGSLGGSPPESPIIALSPL